MTRSRISLSLSLIAVASLVTASAQGELKHRWSFNNGSLVDSVGGANATLVDQAGVGTGPGGGAMT